MSEQLSLPVQLPDDETFDSFIQGDNGHVVSHLIQWLTLGSSMPFLTYLSGDHSTGKSHLLFSACARATEQGMTCTYVSFTQFDAMSPSMLDGLEALDVVCLDDVQVLAGKMEWQTGVFDLINRAKERDCRLLIAGSSGPTQVALELPDLKSRLSWGISFRLAPLDDDGRCAALQSRAQQRGMMLPDEVARFMLNHCQRDMSALLLILDRLDQSSLQAQRRLTIPFVKGVLSL